MRAALVVAALAVAVATPALPQERAGSLEVQTVNGVRVWRPKPAPTPAAPAAAPPSTPVVVVNTPPPAPSDEVVGLPLAAPFFFHRGPFFHRRPFPPHHGPPVRRQGHFRHRPF
jgi:hypothetical protein